MKNYTSSFLLSVLFIFLFCLIGITDSLAVENSQCLECHGDETLSRSGTEDINSRYISMQLFVDEERFTASVHHANGIVCVDCHSDIKELNFAEDIPIRRHLRR